MARKPIYTAPKKTIVEPGTELEAVVPSAAEIASIASPDERSRDDVFGRPAEHVDRWNDLGALAYSKGPAALTQRFLVLLVPQAVR